MEQDEIREAVARFGTPLYLYDEAEFRRAYQALRNCVPREIGILYSMKANPCVGIAEVFRGLGCGVEVASSGELLLAEQAGWSGPSIVFTGPGKTSEELELALRAGAYCNVESREELTELGRTARRLGLQSVGVSIRVNPTYGHSSSGMAMSGVASQFGVDENGLEEVLETARTERISVTGIHVYLGTQVLDAMSIARNVRATFELVRRVSEKLRGTVAFVGLGGGFGVPYFGNETELDMELLREKLHEAWVEARPYVPRAGVFVESGRYLTARAGKFVVGVLSQKATRGQRYLVCDGGSNFHAASAFLGRFIRNNFPMYVLGKRGAEVPFNVVGPLCTPTDVLGQGVALPGGTGPGDLIVVECSGAYGLTHSPVLFLGHRTPAEVLLNDGRLELVRRRSRDADLLVNQHWSAKPTELHVAGGSLVG